LFAVRYKIPPIIRGGLVAYGPRIGDLYRILRAYTGRIINKSNPADLPVYYPTQFDLVINLKTAKALGVTIPTDSLARADEVIE
jgi:putative ABC transport system substrate-binding protein